MVYRHVPLTLAFAAKDWRRFWADPRAAALWLLAPTAAAAGAGFALAPAGTAFGAAALLVVLLWGAEGGAGLLREQAGGAWRRVRVAAVPASAVLLGKALTTAAVALGQLLAVFGLGAVVFGAPLGASPVVFVLLAGVGSALAAATGLLVAMAGRTEAQARCLGVLIALGFAALGFAGGGW